MLTRNALERTLIVAVGVGAGPLVQLLATPILARIYQPSDFGHLALFLAIVGVLVTISCLRFEGAIAVVEDESVNTIAWVALLSAMILFAAVLLLIAFEVPQAIFPAFAALGDEVWGVPLVGVSGGVALVGSYLTLRQGRYLRNALIRSLPSVLFVAIAIGGSSIGLVRANILGALIVGCAVLGYLLVVIAPVSMKMLGPMAQRFRQYPLLLAPTSLLDAAAVTMPIFFISAAYGLESTGHYTQIQRLIGAPMILAGVVVGQLFLKRSGELFREGDSSKPLLWRCVGMLGLGALVMLLVLLLVGEPVCRAVLGQAWRVDTFFLILVTMPFLFKSVISPVSTVFLTHGRVGLGVKWQVAYFVSTISVLYIASKYLSFDSFLIVYAIHEAILYLAYLAMANSVASEPRHK